MSSLDTDIKVVDLRKETLNTVKEAIRIASAINPLEFVFHVNPHFVKSNLITTRIVKIETEAPAFTANPLDYIALKNLKNTLEFAKKVLVEEGEVTVVEKEVPRLATEESTPVTEEEVKVASAEEEPKKKTRKKVSSAADTFDSPAATEESE